MRSFVRLCRRLPAHREDFRDAALVRIAESPSVIPRLGGVVCHDRRMHRILVQDVDWRTL
jgi:hypothetical protein